MQYITQNFTTISVKSYTDHEWWLPKNRVESHQKWEEKYAKVEIFKFAGNTS